MLGLGLVGIVGFVVIVWKIRQDEMAKWRQWKDEGEMEQEMAWAEELMEKVEGWGR